MLDALGPDLKAWRIQLIEALTGSGVEDDETSPSPGPGADWPAARRRDCTPHGAPTSGVVGLFGRAGDVGGGLGDRLDRGAGAGRGALQDADSAALARTGDAHHQVAVAFLPKSAIVALTPTRSGDAGRPIFLAAGRGRSYRPGRTRRGWSRYPCRSR